MKISKLLFLLGILGLAVAVSPVRVLAQTRAEEERARRLSNWSSFETAEYQVRVFRLRNVRASIAAWAIDPFHNPIPPEYKAEIAYKERVPPQGAAFRQSKTLAGWQERFPGLQALIPQDKQNQILVIGTPKGISKATSELWSFDDLWRQIEVEVKFVETDPENIRAAGQQVFSFRPLNLPGTGRTNSVGGGGPKPALKRIVADLVAAGKAKVLSKQRMTLIDGIVEVIGDGYTVPAVVGAKDKKGWMHEVDTKPAGTGTSPLLLGMQSNFLIKVNLSDIESLWVAVEPMRQLNLSVAGQQLPLKTFEPNRVACDLGPGFPVAISTTTYDGTVQDAVGGGKAKNVVLIITPRLIRRPGNNERGVLREDLSKDGFFED